MLTADDLRSDPVLLRRVRRAEMAMQRDDDDELDPDSEDAAAAPGSARGRRVKGSRQSGFTVASDMDSVQDWKEQMDGTVDEDEVDETAEDEEELHQGDVKPARATHS